MSELEDKFTKVYLTNGFSGKESKSGIGSGLEQTWHIRTELPTLLRNFEIKTLVDAPCGDVYWMHYLFRLKSMDKYIGADIVKELIEENQKKYGTDRVTFIQKDIVTEVLPKGDMILCRDCFVHLSYEDIKNALRKFKESGSKYLLTTTFFNFKNNTDLGTQFWRRLNLELPPFNFPKPVHLLVEKCSEKNEELTETFDDKALGLWELDQINIEE